jgi:hypothetical protein
VQVSDPRAKHWLADDANFLATLGDLDRGLAAAGDIPPKDAEESEAAALSTSPVAPRPAPASQEISASRRSARVIEAARALSAAAPTEPVESRPRPLLDLFPDWALMPDSTPSPAPPASGAVDDGPRLPRPPVVARRLESAAPSQHHAPTHETMTRGQQATALAIDDALIEAAADDLELQPQAEGPGLVGGLLISAVFALLVLAGAAGALWASREAVTRTIRQWEQMPLPPGGPIRQLPVPLAPIPPPDAIPDNLRGGPGI